MKFSHVAFAAVVAMGLSACGSGEGADEGGRGDGASVEAERSAAPDMEQRAAILADFRDASEGNCPFFKEAGDAAEEGDFAGSPLVLCSGRFSRTENFGIAMMREDGYSNPAGTLFLTMGANTAPGAFAPLYDLVHELTGMTEDAEKAMFRSEMSRWLYAAPNTYSINYEPMMTTSSGVRISAAGNKMQQGTLTLKIDPPR